MGITAVRYQKESNARQAKAARSVQWVLEWAFAVECAQLELPDQRPAEERGFGFGTEYVLLQRLRLGGVKIDVSRGKSEPHEDAEKVAAVVSGLPDHLGGKLMALRVAEYARARMTPDWMPGAESKWQPREWVTNRHGTSAKTAVESTITTVRRGRSKVIEIRSCPCHQVPPPAIIERARFHYAEWYRALRYLRGALQNLSFRDFLVSDVLPPAKPWERRPK